jgi:hypothetical protein
VGQDFKLKASDNFELGAYRADPSRAGDAEHQTGNLEIPGSLISFAPRNDWKI